MACRAKQAPKAGTTQPTGRIKRFASVLAPERFDATNRPHLAPSASHLRDSPEFSPLPVSLKGFKELHRKATRRHYAPAPLNLQAQLFEWKQSRQSGTRIPASTPERTSRLSPMAMPVASHILREMRTALDVPHSHNRELATTSDSFSSDKGMTTSFTGIFFN